MSERAIILAAGLGSRLGARDDPPKPLRPVAGTPLLIRILRTLAAEGVRDVVVVVGWRGAEIRAALAAQPLNIICVDNPDYEKKNGVSVLAAREHIHGDCLLSMADHLYSPEVVRRLRAFDLPPDSCALAVDRAIERCFDIDDATKVALTGDRITRIGKELAQYDALDAGVFRIGPALVKELAAIHAATGDCSLSDGIGALAASGRMYGCDIGGASWIDVDTPGAVGAAEAMLAELGDRLEHS